MSVTAKCGRQRPSQDHSASLFILGAGRMWILATEGLVYKCFPSVEALVSETAGWGSQA